jgi:hypothetical protein
MFHVKHWLLRLTRIGSYFCAAFLTIASGFFGLPVQRWEVIVWGLTLLGWIWSAERFRIGSEAWRDLFYMKH